MSLSNRSKSTKLLSVFSMPSGTENVAGNTCVLLFLVVSELALVHAEMRMLKQMFGVRQLDTSTGLRVSNDVQ